MQNELLSTEPANVPISGNGAAATGIPTDGSDRATDQGDRATNDEVADAYRKVEAFARRWGKRLRFSELDCDGVANDAIMTAWEKWRRDSAVPLVGLACMYAKYGFLSRRKREDRYAVTGEAWDKLAATLTAPSGSVDGGECKMEEIGRPEVVAVELARAGASIRQLEKIGVTFHEARQIVKEHGPHGGKRPLKNPIQQKARNRARDGERRTRRRACANEQSVAECMATLAAAVDLSRDEDAYVPTESNRSDGASSNAGNEAAA